MLYYLAARKIWHVKGPFDLIRRSIHPYVCTVFYFIIPHLVFIIFSVFYLNLDVGGCTIPQEC